MDKFKVNRSEREIFFLNNKFPDVSEQILASLICTHMHTHTHNEHMCIQHTCARVSKPIPTHGCAHACAHTHIHTQAHTHTHWEMLLWSPYTISKKNTSNRMILVTRHCEFSHLFFYNNFLHTSLWDSVPSNFRGSGTWRVAKIAPDYVFYLLPSLFQSLCAIL